MTAPREEQAGGPPRRRRRRTAVMVGGPAVLLVVAAAVAGIAVSRSASTPAAAAVPVSSPSASASAASPPTPDLPVPDVPTPAGAPASPGKKETPPPAMSAEQEQRTRAELTALAARLPASLRLTAPGAWAGGTPPGGEDITTCPHLADRLAADLGRRWTYSFGKLPGGPFGCYWTPVPWVPDVSRFFVSVGYETGTVPALLKGMDLCAGGEEAPRVDVAAVGAGALLYGCDDAGGPGYDLAVPDSRGAGVFFLHATGGLGNTPAQVADALLAVVDGATRAYG